MIIIDSMIALGSFDLGFGIGSDTKGSLSSSIVSSFGRCIKDVTFVSLSVFNHTPIGTQYE